MQLKIKNLRKTLNTQKTQQAKMNIQTVVPKLRCKSNALYAPCLSWQDL